MVTALAAIASSSLAFAADEPAVTDTSGRAPPATRGVTDTRIKVGGLGQLARYGAADIGAAARFERANAQGGVHGRTFEYLGMRDDAGVGATNAEIAATLVEKDEVFALVPVVTPDLGAVPDLVARRVPYFGWPISSNFCGNRLGFAFTGCMFPAGGETTSNAWGVLVQAAFGPQSSGRTAAIVTENTTSGQYFLRTVTAGVQSAGIRVVSQSSTLPIPAAGDFAALAQQLLTSSAGAAPDAIFVMASYPNVVQLRQALRAAGFLGVFTNTVEYEPGLTASATGSFVMSTTAAVESAATNPAMAQLVADVNKVAPGQPIDQSVVAGYWSADLFITAVERTGRNLTTRRLVRKANDGFTYLVESTVGPVDFPGAHDEPAPCGTLVQSNGSAYVVAVPYRCGEVVDVGN